MTLRRDGARIPDLALAGAASAAGLALSLGAAPGWLGLAGGALAALMAVIAVIDRRRLIIPDGLNAAAFCLGLAVSGLGAESLTEAISQSVARAAVMFTSFLILRAGFRRLRGVDGLGYGDVKLAAVAGVWLDWAWLPLAVNIAALTALTVVLAQRLRNGRVDLLAKLPFGAFFAPSIWVCWLMMTWDEKAALAQPFVSSAR